ncbi:c-5 sterol desaturase [Neurospora sp. IMI 360204]|nr:c-5 sterol desaturase [Neurospora sp. IMI 360204]
MDAALEILDPLVLDRLYAYLLPAVTTPTADGSVLGNGFDNSTSAFSKSPSQSSYGSAWPRDNILRQCASILLITQVGATLLYWVFSAFSYYFIFDRRLEYHPRFLKNQVRQEIISSMNAVPWINIMTLPFFLAEVRGKSFLYTRVDDYGWAWMAISTVLFMIWNDLMIYWIHRLEHHPSVYKYIHKPHHKWIGRRTPSVWTIFIHDGDMISGHWLEKYINSPAHHTLHHMYFTVNYGQYFTWADNYFQSHRAPRPDLDPLHDALKVMREKGLVDEKGNPIPQKNKKDE